MRKIKKILLFALAKVILLFFPAALIIFYFCYVVDEVMIAHGMKKFSYIPALLSALFLYYIAKILIGDDLRKMAKLRIADRDGDSSEE